MVVAKSHITAQRGQGAGIATASAGGTTIRGSQPFHGWASLPVEVAHLCCASAIGTFELNVCFRMIRPGGRAT